MLNYLKKKFGFNNDKEVPTVEQFYTPMRIALHSTVLLDATDLMLLQSNMHPSMKIPIGQLEVLAIGKVDMDGIPVHRVYVMDTQGEEFVLQLTEGKDYRSQKPVVDEIILFKEAVSFEPETESSMSRALNDIGFMDLELDDVKYDRMWGDEFTEKMDFRTYSENIVTPGGTQQATDNYILYGRTISGVVGDDTNEFLLVGIEENETDAQIVMQVGIQLHPNVIQIQ